MADTAQDQLEEGVYNPEWPKGSLVYTIQLAIPAGEDSKGKPPVIVIDKDTAKLEELKRIIKEYRNRTGQEHPDEPTELVTLIKGDTPLVVYVRPVRKSKNE